MKQTLINSSFTLKSATLIHLNQFKSCFCKLNNKWLKYHFGCIFWFLILFQISIIGQTSPYFQQEVNYNISVALDDQHHFLHGSVEIEYVNNSPDELEFLYFHLWPNAYKNNETALAKQQFQINGKSKLFKLDSNRGYIDSLDFSVNGEQVLWEYDIGHIDICSITLKEPLKPGQQINIRTPFRVKLPRGGISRLGHVDQSYQVTQWYPKPAVYDNRGWHQMPYLDKGEFYSEFGTFHVKITLPEDYTIAASGNLRTLSEIKRLDQLAGQNKQVTGDTHSRETSQNQLKTLEYVMVNAHDFAWFADKNYVVDKDSVQLPNSGKFVTTWAFYVPEQEGLWKKSTHYINDAVRFYSEKVGDYPYKQCTAVAGPLGSGGGMEYPGITIIGDTRDSISLNQVIMHEVGHNWFYAVIGSNERMFPFLDEGINTHYEMQYMLSRYPDLKLHEFAGIPSSFASFLNIDSQPYYLYYYLPYEIPAKMNFDQSNLLHSDEYTMYNYFAIVYLKSAFVLNYLKAWVGEANLDKAMHHYYKKWKFRHPYPDDFRKSVEESLDKNIDWFYEQLLPTTRKVDYKIKKVNGDSAFIVNSGNIQSPFLLEGMKDGNTEFSEWYEPISNDDWVKIPTNQIDKLVVDPSFITTDLYRKNNYYHLNHFNKKFEPLRFKFLLGLEDPSRNTIYYAPVIGWNNYNKTMAGLWLHSGILKKKRVEYQLLPMYGFGNNDLAGSAKFNVFFPLRGGIFRNIDLSISGVRYGYTNKASFNRFTAGLDFLFDTPLEKNVFNTLHTRYTFASDMQYLMDEEQDPPYDYFYNLSFSRQKKGRVNPYKITANLESGPKYMKASLEANYRISYTTRGGLDIRAFMGKFIVNNNPSFIYDFSLSGRKGSQDYRFEHVFLNRFGNYPDDLFSRQFVPSDGGFALFFPFGYSDDWLGSVNLTSNLPKIPMLKPFVNTAFTKTENDGGDFTLYAEGGLMLGGNLIGIYFPMFSSEDISSYLSENTSTYWQRVRFVFRLEELNLFKLRELILFSL